MTTAELNYLRNEDIEAKCYKEVFCCVIANYRRAYQDRYNEPSTHSDAFIYSLWDYYSFFEETDIEVLNDMHRQQQQQRKA
jgi:hypothetical protein